MSIIYSYPEQTALNDNDTLLGTSAALVGGKKKNITRNFSLSELNTYFGVGSIINPIASDFKLAVFNQGGAKITDSIISQDALAGTSVTIAGNLTANTTTLNGFLTVNGGANLGTGAAGELIAFGSTTRLNAPIQDQLGVVGALDQILISDTAGRVSWQNYTSGLTYTGTWDATNNITAPQGNSLVSSVGTNGEFYIVTVSGNTQLNGQPVTPTTPPYWNVGDWVVFVENGGAGVWQKIDNTSVLTGTGTDNKIAMWTGGATPSVTLTDSLISQDAGATTVTVAGSITSTGSISGVNITGTGDLSGDNLLLTGTVSLNAQLGNPGQVLTSQGAADAIWANPTPVNNITGSGTANTLSMFTGQYTVGDSIVTQDAGGTIVTTAGNSSITGYIQPATLQDAGASPGTAGQVLTSTGTALDWVDANTVGDTYTISSTTTPGANRVPIDLTATSGAGASSILNLVEGSGITLTQTSSTEITIASTSTSVVNSLQQISGTNVSTTALDLTGTASGGVLIGNITIALNEFGGGNFIGTVPSASGVTNVGFLDYTGNWSDAVVSVLASTSTPINNSIGAQSIQAFTNVAGAVEINSYKFNGNGKPGAVVSTSSANDNLYLKGDGSWASVPAQGVTSVSGTANRISVTAGNTPIVDAITSAVSSISTNLATGAQIQTAINAAVANVGAFQGAYDAANNTPDLDVAPSAAIQNGWFWAVTVAGTFFSENVQIGDFIFANQDNPGATFANWTVIQSGQDIAGSGTTDGATVKGVAGFNSNDFDVSVNGWVEAKDFSGSTPGYVPDATSATAGTFLKEDGTWSAIAPTAGVGSYTTGNGTILSPQTTSVQLAISAISMSGSVFTFVNGLNLGDLVQITDGTVNGFFTYTAAGGGPNGYRFAYVSGEIPTNFSTASNVINLRNANAGVVGDISGSGNGSSVTYFTGVVGDTGVKEITSNPNIVIDATGNLGVGTTSPNARVHSFSSSDMSQLTVDATGAYKSGINFANGGTVYGQIYFDNNSPYDMSMLQQYSTGSLILGTNSTEQMRIDSSGNVGIGTISPSAELEVAGSVNNADIGIRINNTFDDNNPASEPNSSVFLNAASNNGYLRVHGAPANTAAKHQIDLGSTAATSFLTFSPSGSERMRVASDGNVGIGTTSPATKLHVASSESANWTTTFQNTLTSDSHSVYTAYNNSSSGLRYGVYISGSGTTSSDYHLLINNEFAVVGSGNVGIGTITPEVSLDLGTKTDAVQLPAGDNTARAAISNPSGGMIRYNTTDDQFEGYSGVGAAGSWGAIGGGGGASATITSNQTTTTNATTTVFALGATPNGSSVNFVDAFIDGVYQETTTYSVSGQNLTFNDPVPSGVTVETKTTADYNVGAVVTTASLGQTNTTGNVNLRIIPNYIISNITAQANNLYIFDSTTQAYTLTLPSSPQPGDSIKISIRGGLATNVLAVPATENIMGGVLGAPLTINNATAAFEIIYSGDSTKQGWVIIGNV